MEQPSPFRRSLTLMALAVIGGACVPALSVPAYGAEHITLRNGFELDCARREVVGNRVRLYLLPDRRTAAPAENAAAPPQNKAPNIAQGTGQAVSQNSNYIEVAASAVLRAEPIPDPAVAAASSPSAVARPTALHAAAPPTAASRAAVESERTAASTPSPSEMARMLAQAGARHDIDSDLLASVVQAESGGNAQAVSRAGAEGLMQLMPGTAAELGVRDPFAPRENIGGGTAYLDALLTRYNNNIKLAVAAYNAGPAAVDRYRGVPPYAETRAYVARVIREFNRRKRAARASYRSETRPGTKAPPISRP